MKNKILIWLIVVILLVSNLQAVAEEKNPQPKELQSQEEQTERTINFNGLPENANQGSRNFKGNNFDAILDKNSTVTVETNKDGSKTIKLTGSGTITIKEKPSLDNIKNAKIILGKNNEIEFATFTALNNQLYKFKYNEEEIEITANKDSIITFDPKNKEKQLIGYNLKEIEYKNSKIKPSKGLTVINFDGKTKEIKELKLPGNSQYINEERELSFSNENEFNVYFDGRNIKDSKKDAVSVSDNLIRAKGKIKIENKKFKITYQGNDNNVYTEYNSEFQSFDIKFGDAKISNGVSTVEIKNGRELLNLQKGVAEPFSYRYSIYRGKEEKVYYTRINQGDLLYGDLEVVSFSEGKENIVGVYSRGVELRGGIGSSILAGLKRSSEEDEEAKNTEIAPYLTPEKVLQLEAIEKEIERLKQINEDVPEDILRARDALEWEDLQGEVERLTENKRVNEAWGKINDYLKKERSPEAIALANLELHSVFKNIEEEYKKNLEYFEQKPDSKTLYENSRSMYEKYKNLADRSFERVVDVYQDLKKDKDKNEEVTLKLGSLFLQKGDFGKANDEFSELITFSENKEAISSAYLGKSMIRLSQNLPESALLNLKLAVENDPNNENAKEVYKNLQISLLNSIRDGRYGAFKEQYKVFNEKLNTPETSEGKDEKFWQSFSNTFNNLAAEFGVMNLDIEKLNLKGENMGAAAIGAQFLSRLIERGVDLKELSKKSYLERKEIIGKTLDMSYLSQKEIENLFLSKTPEERRKLIKDSLGYEPDIDKISDKNVASWLKHLEIRRTLITKEKGKIYADIDETLGNIAFSTIAAERDWDTALLIASGDVEKAKEIMKQRGVNEKKINEKSRYMEFDFKTGRDYDEKSNIQKKWIDSVNGAINLKNAAWFLVPGALARPVGKALSYIPGAAKVIGGGVALKKELSFSRAFASQWSIDNMPAMRHVLSFGTEGGLEWISGYFTGSQLAELSVAYLPIIRTTKPPRLTDIFDLKGERILGYTFENKNALNEFLNKNKIKQLTEDVYEINGKKLVVLVKGKEAKTEGLKSLLNVGDIKTQEVLTKSPDLSIEVRTRDYSEVGGTSSGQTQATTKQTLETVITNVQGKNPNTGETSISKLYAGLTQKNAKDIFQTSLEHKFGEGIMGSKAIVYQDYQGKYRVAFLTEATNTHHRQAAATIAKLMDLPNSDPSILERKVNALYNGNSDEAKDLLTKVTGFELQYDKKTGKIIGIQQDSWLTKEQMRKKRFVNKKIEDDMVTELLSNIDPSIMDAKLLENENLKKLFIKRE